MLIEGQLLNDGNTRVFYLVSKYQKVGFSQIRIKAGCSANFPAQCASHIYYEIYEKYRNNGYGQRLLSLTIEKAKALGIAEVIVSCGAENIISQKLIEGLCTFTEEFVGKNGDRLLMYVAGIEKK